MLLWELATADLAASGRRDTRLFNEGKRDISLDQNPRGLFRATSGPQPHFARPGPPATNISTALFSAGPRPPTVF